MHEILCKVLLKCVYLVEIVSVRAITLGHYGVYGPWNHRTDLLDTPDILR